MLQPRCGQRWSLGRPAHSIRSSTQQTIPSNSVRLSLGNPFSILRNSSFFLDGWISLRFQWKPTRDALELLSEPYLSYMQELITAKRDTTVHPKLYFTFDSSFQQTTILTTDLSMMHLQMISDIRDSSQKETHPVELGFRMLAVWFTSIEAYFRRAASKWESDAIGRVSNLHLSPLIPQPLNVHIDRGPRVILRPLPRSPCARGRSQHHRYRYNHPQYAHASRCCERSRCTVADRCGFSIHHCRRPSHRVRSTRHELYGGPELTSWVNWQIRSVLEPGMSVFICVLFIG